MHWLAFFVKGELQIKSAGKSNSAIGEAFVDLIDDVFGRVARTTIIVCLKLLKMLQPTSIGLVNLNQS